MQVELSQATELNFRYLSPTNHPNNKTFNHHHHGNKKDMNGKVCVFGSFNVDIVAKVKRFPKNGETLIAKETTLGPGGKGANQALAAHCAGAKVHFATKVGKDQFQQFARNHFQSCGIESISLYESNKARITSYNVCYTKLLRWLNSRTWLAHGIHFNSEEIERLGKAKIGIAHCPTSNMMLASGICKNLELEAAGVKVGLGVDGSASNDGSNLIAEVRMAMYLQRLKYGSANVSHMDALRWATKGSAQAMGRDDIGELDVGKQADIAMFKLDDIRFSGSHDPLAALILCGAQQADRVMVAGQWRVIDSQVVGIDLAALLSRHRSAAKRLAEKASKFA